MTGLRKLRVLCAAACVLLLLAPGPLSGADDFLQRLKGLGLSGEFESAQGLLERYRPQFEPLDPEWLAGVSWVARAAARAGRWEQAEIYATRAWEGALKLLRERELDSDPHLATAMGAAIEVLGKSFDAAGDRAGAAQFLAEQRARFRGTSIEARIQKNYLLLSLEGQPMPEIETARHAGELETPPLSELRGKVVLFYFWAHWCSDCKLQKPILERLHAEFGPRGLTIIGPTRLYGYVAGGEPATPRQELAYIRGPYQEEHPIPDWMPLPLSARNFQEFGVSSTPTLVLVDRAGIVQMYHPGLARYEELAGRIQGLLSGSSD